MPSRYYQDRLTQLQEQVAEALQKQNKVKLGDGYLVRIPRLPGKIRLVPRDNGGSYVEYIYGHWYDKEEKQSRNKKAIIGITVEPYKNAMLPNDNYTDFFDMETGKLLKEEAAEEPKEEAEKENEQQDEKQNNQQKDKEQEAEEDKEAIYDRSLQEILKTIKEFREQNEKKKLRDDENKLRQELYNEEENPDNDSEAAFLYLKKLFEENTEDENMKTTQDNHPDEAQGAEQGKAQDREQDKKQENQSDDYTLEQNYDIVQQFRERTAILVHILRAIQASIQTQAKKHPDVIINQFKAEKINVILSEIKDKYTGTGYEDLLELIEEPGEEEKDGRIIRTGPTYSDVDVLLAHYVTILKFIKAKV